jgi:nucleotide-binding universal stress UspA family protein
MFKKILVPVDGSDESRKALELAKGIASGCQTADITLLYVMNPVILAAAATPGDEKFISAVPEILVFRQQEADMILEEMAKLLADTPVQVERKALEGHPARTILETANEGHYELIVMGSRGMSRLAGFLLGSVSDAVVHHAHCPVMIVR